MTVQDEIHTFLEEWHRIVRERDVGAITAMLCDDVTVGAPPYWAKLEGRELVANLLGIILETIEDFTYHRQWINGREIALEFRGHIGKLELQGIDLVTLDDGYSLENLDVMIRPLSSLHALRDRVGARMAEVLAATAGD